MASVLCLCAAFGAYAQVSAGARAWIAGHKDASSESIDAFVRKELAGLTSLDAVYATLDAFIAAYAQARLPVSVYVTYARFAELSFDFKKARDMYVRAYKKTKEERYLIRASIHALESGDGTGAFAYLAQLEDSDISDAQRIVLNVMQAKALMQDGQRDMALALLQTLPFVVGQEKLTSSFYYTLYHVAKNSNKSVQANLAHQILTEQFPYSIEVYMLNAPRVQPLPLPSRLLSVRSEILNSIKDTIGISAPVAESATENVAAALGKEAREAIEIQAPPKVGYQVAAFTDLENAKNALEYYYGLWQSWGIERMKRPILAQKDVAGSRFYQVIFPFDDELGNDAQAQQRIVKQLREHNLEGGFITQ